MLLSILKLSIVAKIDKVYIPKWLLLVSISVSNII
jgi:hypothetical protein